MRKLLSTCAALMIFGLSSAAHAVMLGPGSISLASVPTAGQGPYIPVDGVTGAQATLELATGIDFTNTGALTPGVAGPFQVNAASGSLAGFLAAPGTIQDFSFAGAGSANYPLVPITTFESIAGGLTFDLQTVSIIMQTSSTLNLSGTGLFNLAGFDPTPGTWVFTGNTQGGTFSFSASQAIVTPAPASLALFGLGLAALGIRRRRSTV